MALAGVQFGLALLAITLDLLRACGACEVSGTRIHLWIAVAGAAGYLGLVLLGWTGRKSFFYFGVFTAAGVHTVLAMWMISAPMLCIPCIASALVAIALPVSALASRAATVALVERAYVPSLLVAGSIGFALLLWQGGRKAERDRNLALLTAGPSTGGLVKAADAEDRESEALSIVVVEMADCPYCTEFRQEYLPRLRSDFGHRIEVSFVDVREVPGVERTPTIAIENGPVYEGLPLRYEHLHESVSEALAGRQKRR